MLKIERYYGPGHEAPNCWWLLDDIRKISHYRYKDQPFNQEFADVDANAFFLDYGPYLNKMGNGQSDRDVIKLVCRMGSGDEYIVIFDTLAYILNDNGKTIEKLVANHR
jgi:hypothetical protein